MRGAAGSAQVAALRVVRLEPVGQLVLPAVAVVAGLRPEGVPRAAALREREQGPQVQRLVPERSCR